jgi:hypothetical protein
MKAARSTYWRRAALVTALLVVAIALWAALAPIAPASREQVFEIPRGTHQHRMAGHSVDILPQTIHLTLGVKDLLVFKNSDSAPHIFGPTLIMPGQSFRLPFSQASTYSFQCTAHANGQLNIIVDAEPTAGWQRLSWRWRSIFNAA